MPGDVRAALLKRVALDLESAQRNLPAALEQLNEQQAGPTGSRIDTDRVSSSPATYEIDEHGKRIPIAAPTDPTGDAAIARLTADINRVDPALAALRQLDQAMRILETASRNVRDLAAFWGTTDHSRTDDDGCEIVGAFGVWEPTHRKAFDLDGELPLRLRVGRWAYDFMRRERRLPTDTEIRAHIEGKPVRQKAKR